MILVAITLMRLFRKQKFLTIWVVFKTNRIFFEVHHNAILCRWFGVSHTHITLEGLSNLVELQQSSQSNELNAVLDRNVLQRHGVDRHILDNVFSHALGDHCVGSGVWVVGEGHQRILSRGRCHGQVLPVGVTGVLSGPDVVGHMVLRWVKVLVADGVALDVALTEPVLVLQTEQSLALDQFLREPSFSSHVVRHSRPVEPHASQSAGKAGSNGVEHCGGGVVRSVKFAHLKFDLGVTCEQKLGRGGEVID